MSYDDPFPLSAKNEGAGRSFRAVTRVRGKGYYATGWQVKAT